jgi:hypothetical protein
MTAVQTRARVLLSSDLAALRSLVHADRVVNCVLDARIQLIGDLDPHRLGGHVWAIDDPATGSLRAAVFHGGNLIPVGTDTVALEAIAEQFAPTASLYVNDFNTPARRMYERLGMQQTNTFSTVLF